jgi:hypothetical protein
MRERSFDEFGGYHVLMRHRVEKILLVASPYDCFILEEDGRFSDRVFSRYLELNLSRSPRFHRVSSGSEAIEELRSVSYDLVIMTPNIVGADTANLAETIKADLPNLPIVLLAYDRITAKNYSAHSFADRFDEVFLWSGDPTLMLVIIKTIEDRLNVIRDTRKGGVRVIMLVEDSPGFYSSYLPILYTEVLNQTRTQMPEALHGTERMYRMRARPKIMLAKNFEAAQVLITRFREYLLGVILDMNFPRDGRQDSGAGRALLELIRDQVPSVPVLFQSADAGHSEFAKRHSFVFSYKRSPDLLAELRNFVVRYLGFGSFIFRLPNEEQVDCARDMEEMISVLGRVPLPSFCYHAERHDFSNWLMARSQFRLAQKIRRMKVEDFASPDETRERLVTMFREHLDQRQRGIVTEYSPGKDLLHRDFTRIGDGSMGGKARGIAFASATLARHALHETFPDVKIIIPRTMVLCTEVFDSFCDRERLRDRVMESGSDDEIVDIFLSQPLDDKLMSDLDAILAEIHFPLAVRSSSLFEDSAFEPFAGLYETIILPNVGPRRQRLVQLSKAIRLVFASTFFSGPKAYREAGALRLEEEKMAVIIQRLVGATHGERFYPTFSGVAQSHNFYPIQRLEAEDGIATVVLGLGQMVVEGGRSFRFCPGHPEVDLQMGGAKEFLGASQYEFYALPMDSSALRTRRDTLRLFELEAARSDGSLEHVGGTYSSANDRIYDTIHREGIPVVNFAPVLKHKQFPLAPILTSLLAIGVEGFGSAVELEFAANLDRLGRPEFALLQLRPMVTKPILPMETSDGEVLGRTWISGPAFGSGLISELAHVVYIHPDRFSSLETEVIARHVHQVNAALSADGRGYVLIGPGRWGTADPCLGIPVDWEHISAVRAIVELPAPSGAVEPSQGAHFFHNLISLRIGYFHLDPREADQFVDLKFLESLPAEYEVGSVRCVSIPGGLVVTIDPEDGWGEVQVRGGASAD